jgi:hypothetical protein
VKKVITLVPEIGNDVFIVAGISVFLLAILSCLIFTVISIVPRKKSRRRFNLFLNPKSRSLRGGSLKYAFLSIERGNLRSLVAVLVALSAVILLYQLTGTMEQYQARLEDVRNNARVRGYFTDVNGQQLSGLSIDGLRINEVYRSGMISDICVTKSFSYCYMGRRTADGAVVGAPQVEIPKSSFGWETFLYQLSQGPRIIFTNSLKNAPEFIYSSTVITEFLDGYDESVLSREVNGTPCCLIATAFMEENGIRPGDTIQVMVYNHDTGRTNNLDTCRGQLYEGWTQG